MYHVRRPGREQPKAKARSRQSLQKPNGVISPRVRKVGGEHFGIVCVESGYELHVGGNGGTKVRATDFLCKVQTEEQVLEYCCAFLQLYREEARYLERTAPWIERVGLTYVRSRIADDEAGRFALAARFLQSQKHCQVDPWAERAGGKDAEEFSPLMARDIHEDRAAVP